MSVNDIISQFPRLAIEQQIHFLAHLTAELTVWARGTYEVGTERVSDPVRLRAFNEFQHRMLGHLRNLIDGENERYPDDVVAQMLVDYARGLDCEAALLITWQR